MKLTEEDYLNAVDSMEGYCSNCDELTRSETEPDAEEYDCPACHKNTVMGMEQALLFNFIEIV